MKPTPRMRVLLALAAIFVAPLALAWTFYYVHDGHSGLPHGELLHPLQPLILPHLKSVDGASLDSTLFHGRWTLLYHTRQHCDAACLQLLATLQQVRVAQGAAMAQIQRVLVFTVAPSSNALRVLNGSGDDLRVVSVKHWPLISDHLYLLDPQGNLVMRYPPGFEPRGLHRDLQRLLQVAKTE